MRAANFNACQRLSALLSFVQTSSFIELQQCLQLFDQADVEREIILRRLGLFIVSLVIRTNDAELRRRFSFYPVGRRADPPLFCRPHADTTTTSRKWFLGRRVRNCRAGDNGAMQLLKSPVSLSHTDSRPRRWGSLVRGGKHQHPHRSQTNVNTGPDRLIGLIAARISGVLEKQQEAPLLISRTTYLLPRAWQLPTTRNHRTEGEGGEER